MGLQCQPLFHNHWNLCVLITPRRFVAQRFSYGSQWAEPCQGWPWKEKCIFYSTSHGEGQILLDIFVQTQSRRFVSTSPAIIHTYINLLLLMFLWLRLFLPSSSLTKALVHISGQLCTLIYYWFNLFGQFYILMCKHNSAAI